VLVRSERHRERTRQLEAEDVLGVVGHTRSEAMTPLQIDLEGIGKVPARELPARGSMPGFLATSRAAAASNGSPASRASRHRLPEARAARPLQQQDFEVDRVDHDENRDRQLVAHAS
jgi:hypothetical protein